MSLTSPLARRWLPRWLVSASLLGAICTLPAFAAGIEPSDLEAARKLYDTRRLAEAQQAFEKLARADPAHADVNYYLGDLALRRDDHEKAVAYLEKAAAKAPSDARTRHGLGQAYGSTAQKASTFSKLGWAKKCLAAFQKAVELEPTNTDYRLSLFDYYRNAPGIVGGGTDKAAAQAAEIKKLDAHRGRLAFATLYVDQKKFEQAFAEFDEALKADPNDYRALFQIGRFAALTGQFVDRGLSSLHRCLELTPPAQAPSHAAAHWRIGNLLEKKSDAPGARTAYEAALKIDPKFNQAAEALKKLTPPPGR